jgi:DNA-binding HxlR family transcriptional regulator
VFVLRMATTPVNRQILLETVGREVEAPDGPLMKAAPAGVEALFVGGVAERWLERVPGRKLELEGDRGQAVLGALMGGWSTTIVHALAAAPASRPELEDRLDLPRRLLREKLARMLATGLLIAPGAAEDDQNAAYAPTDCLRRGLAPLLAAARHEARNPVDGKTIPPTPLDVEGAFRLALPLLRLREGTSGSCALAVALDPEVAAEPCGVTARFEEGRVAAIEPGLDPAADARAAGSALDWLDTVIDAPMRVRREGDRALAAQILTGLRKTLFG